MKKKLLVKCSWFKEEATKNDKEVVEGEQESSPIRNFGFILKMKRKNGNDYSQEHVSCLGMRPISGTGIVLVMY